VTGENSPAVYCGTSAGAIIMGEWMETACWKVWWYLCKVTLTSLIFVIVIAIMNQSLIQLISYLSPLYHCQQWDDPSVVPGMEAYEAWKAVKGFGLAGNVSIFPHMTDDWKSVVEEKKMQLESTNSIVHCLTDEECCFVNGPERSVSVVSYEGESSSICLSQVSG
jgi:hypothetical protein